MHDHRWLDILLAGIVIYQVFSSLYIRASLAAIDAMLRQALESEAYLHYLASKEQLREQLRRLHCEPRQTDAEDTIDNKGGESDR